MGKHWVGAGHLKIGDKIKQADGTTGVVANVVTLQQTREMFNLTVSEAHTYYVGTQGWLVHNCNAAAAENFLLNNVPGLAKQNKVTAVYDKATGKWYYGTSGSVPKNPHELTQGLIDNALQNVTNPPRWSCGNCGEFNALDNAVKGVASSGRTPQLSDFEMFTFMRRGRGDNIRLIPEAPCAWCQTLRPNVGKMYP
ncbi:HINT domain-containing protein [Deinococcus metallilatus]|uniref:HINT domain-containing protein n=1 Tax=Deinococcus metallilatus TaxID=1211322 RepID=UPI0021A6AC6C|nr:HINT domain-containing protein [Deinococcus metallilatus]